MTVVVDTTASGEVDLYADADRNLKIDDRDRVTAAACANQLVVANAILRVPLAVALIENSAVRTVSRIVVFRLGASGQTLGFAVAGFLEGHVTLGEPETKAEQNAPSVPTLAARRVDGDGNGLLTDMQDRLWIDLNRDGHFDPSSEQFLYTSVVNLDGTRYVVLSDELGCRLAFRPLVGTGTLRLVRKGHEPSSPAHAVEMHATAISRDGSVFAVTGSEPATVPAGEYRLGTVTLALDDAKTGRRWSFVFSGRRCEGPAAVV